MSSCLLDTHSWVWSFTGNPLLSRTASAFIAECNVIYVSPFSIFEIGLKVRKGKWPAMAPHIDGLAQRLALQGASIPKFTPEIALLAANLSWPHTDPFDRFLAATALELQLPFVSADAEFDSLTGLEGWRGRIW